MFAPMRVLLTLALVAASPCAAPAQDAPRKIAPPFATAPDAPLDPKEMVDAEADDHTRLRVEFNGIKADRVPAYLYLPKTKEKRAPAPAVVLQYGIGGNKKTDYIVAVGKQFVARGFVVLTIDAPGVGERRTKDKKTNAILGLLGGEQIMHYCGDYSRAVDFLCTRPEVDRDRLGFVGISWGAITGITFVAHEPRIKAMASILGGGNFLGGFTPKAAEKAAAEGSTSSDPIFHIGRIAPRPLMFVNGTKDQLIMRRWAESLHKAAGPGARVVWVEADHYLKGVDRVEVCDAVIDFVEQAVREKRRDKAKD